MSKQRGELVAVVHKYANEKERAIYLDLLHVVRDCMACPNDECNGECAAFTRAQLSEIAEAAASGNYTQIYTD